MFEPGDEVVAQRALVHCESHYEFGIRCYAVRLLKDAAPYWRYEVYETNDQTEDNMEKTESLQKARRLCRAAHALAAREIDYDSAPVDLAVYLTKIHFDNPCNSQPLVENKTQAMARDLMTYTIYGGGGDGGSMDTSAWGDCGPGGNGSSGNDGSDVYDEDEDWQPYPYTDAFTQTMLTPWMVWAEFIRRMTAAQINYLI